MLPVSPAPAIDVEAPLCTKVKAAPKVATFIAEYVVPFTGCVGAAGVKDRTTKYPLAVPEKLAGNVVEVRVPETKVVACAGAVHAGTA